MAAQPTAKLLNATAREAVNEAAQGREIKYIKLFKPEGSSLGFSVVGLKSAHKGELGIYVQEIQPQGIAGKDGRLQEGDQVCCLLCFLKSNPALSSRLASIPQLFSASIGLTANDMTAMTSAAIFTLFKPVLVAQGCK